MNRLWAPGEQALYRFRRLDGSISQIHPLRVVSDDGRQLIGWLPPDTPIRGTRLAGGRDQREATLGERFRLPREAFASTWRNTANVRLVDEQAWSSVWWFFSPTGEFTGWYVNLEIPLGRTEHTLDRVDGVLDVRVEPDLTCSWKDEDEADAAVEAGLFTAAQMSELRREGDRMISLAQRGEFPFDGSWCEFRPDPSWPLPTLSEEIVLSGHC